MEGHTLPNLDLFKRCLPASFLLALAGPLAAQTTEWVYHKTADGLHPDGNEQQLVWLMNRARSNPAAEGVFLANTGDEWVALGIQAYGVNVTLMRSEFAQIPAQPPAAFDRRIYEGSRAHSLDLIARNAQDHTGQSARIANAGFSSAGGSISVYSYGETVLNVHGALNIDWGAGPGGMQTGRGHRAGIMGSSGNVGFAMVPTVKHYPNAGPLVFSGAYLNANTTPANHYNRFLVGTVWTDGNGNNRYDPGEGVNGVLVQPNMGQWHAVTGAAGGWSIPVSAPGTFTLTFSGGGLGNPIVRTVDVAAVSVLVDLKVTPSAGPFALEISREPSGSLLLVWSGGTGPFQVQRSTTLAAGSWQNVGAQTSGRSMSVAPSGPRGYYRVVGQ